MGGPSPGTDPPAQRQILQRKLRQLFPDEFTRARVRRALAEYGAAKHEREPDRVRLAVLKLSDGTSVGVEKYVGYAKRDYRDVLAWAEYPNQIKAGLVKDERRRQALREQDAAQYRAWLQE